MPNSGKQKQASGGANTVNGSIPAPVAVPDHVSANVAVGNAPPLNGTKIIDTVNRGGPKLPLTEFQRREYLCSALIQELRHAASASRRPTFAGSFKELADPKSDVLLLLRDIAASVSARVGLPFR